MRMTADELVNLRARAAGRPSVVQMRDAPAEKTRRDGQKYGNTRVDTADGLRFDSKAEHRRWIYLRHLEAKGEIGDLRRQVPFELIPATPKPSGGKERACTYVADFVYIDDMGEEVVEDVKGAVTPEFRLKRKLMLHVHGIEVKEIRS